MTVGMSTSPPWLCQHTAPCSVFRYISSWDELMAWEWPIWVPSCCPLLPLSILGSSDKFLEAVCSDEGTSLTTSQDTVSSWALGTLPGTWTRPLWVGRGWYAVNLSCYKEWPWYLHPISSVLVFFPSSKVLDLLILFYFKSLHVPSLSNLLWFSCTFLEEGVRQLSPSCSSKGSKWVSRKSWSRRCSSSCSLVSPSS